MTASDRDAVVVGGGPAGTGAGVFCARYGLDTLVFDRGAAALSRAAFVENYPGFPAGIDPETLRTLLHDHLEEAGAAVVPETVESVERAEGGFRVETSERTVTADYVVAAAWYDGSYLRPATGDEAFHWHEHHGEREERFDPDYPGADGRTPVDGLYVAAHNGDRNDQAIVAAGQGAHVARSLLEDHRRNRVGFPPGVAPHYDWLRPESEFTGEWGDRDRWREWFANEAGDHELPDERFVELRERYIDRAFETSRTDEEVEHLRARGHRRLAEYLDDDAMLEVIDDDVIREYAAELQTPTDAD